jgi:hypothetical protein
MQFIAVFTGVEHGLIPPTPLKKGGLLIPPLFKGGLGGDPYLELTQLESSINARDSGWPAGKPAIRTGMGSRTPWVQLRHSDELRL